MCPASRPYDPNLPPSSRGGKQIVPLTDKRVVCVNIWTGHREIGGANLERKRQTQGRNVIIEMRHFSRLADAFGRTPIILQKRQQCILNAQHDASSSRTEPIHEAHELQRVAKPLLVMNEYCPVTYRMAAGP